MIRTLITLFLIVGLSACQTLSQNNPKILAERYTLAVEDTSVATPYKISHNLISITAQNDNLIWKDDNKKELKVVTWKSKVNHVAGASVTSPKENYVIWVTAASQVQNFCRDYLRQNPNASADDLDLRLKQYLGLNQNWNYDLFIELWIDPKDLFRPCVDPEIDDNSCNLAFSNRPKRDCRGAGYCQLQAFLSKPLFQ